MAKAKVFITGGAGFIGSYVTRRLLEMGHEVTTYDAYQQYIWPLPGTYFENIQWRHEHLLKGARMIYGSMQDVSRLCNMIEQYEPTHVLHLASLPVANAALRRREEAFRSILGSTFNILEVLSGTPIENFVYVSSSMAYGHFTQDPQPTHVPMNPIGVYGAMKCASEVLVRSYAACCEVPSLVVRPSAVYGPGDNNHRVIQIVCERALSGQEITLYNADETFLDFTYVEDTAQGMIKALFAPDNMPERMRRSFLSGQPFNITRGRAKTLRMIGEIIQLIVPGALVKYEEKADQFRPKRGALDISRSKEMLGYVPVYNIMAGMATYLRWMREVNKSLCS